MFPPFVLKLLVKPVAYGHGPPVTSPVVLSYVQVVAGQFTCTAVNTKVVAVGAAAVTVTPVVGANPGGTPRVKLPATAYALGVEPA